MDERDSLYFPGREHDSNEDWPRDRVVVPTLEEIRHAEQLRLQIRSAYEHERRAVPPPGFWAVGVE